MGKIAKAIKRKGFGKAIVMLQEVGKWFGGVCADGFVVHSRGPEEGCRGSDCGAARPTSEAYAECWIALW